MPSVAPISEAMKRIKPSPTIAMTDKARDAEGGRAATSSALSAGEPDFDTPDNIKEAAIAAIRDGQDEIHRRRRHPRAEEGDLRQVQARERARLQAAQVTVGTGGKQVLFNALMATVNPGDEVIIPAPYWVSYPDIVHAGGRQAGVRRDDARARLQAAARGARARDHAEDQMVDLQLAVQPERRRLYARPSSRS